MPASRFKVTIQYSFTRLRWPYTPIAEEYKALTLSECLPPEHKDKHNLKPMWSPLASQVTRKQKSSKLANKASQKTKG